MTVRAPRGGRIEAIDAARGTAMLLVCLGHFTFAHFPLDLHELIDAVRTFVLF
jgi:uncharacterized membrane protein